MRTLKQNTHRIKRAREEHQRLLDAAEPLILEAVEDVIIDNDDLWEGSGKGVFQVRDVLWALEQMPRFQALGDNQQISSHVVAKILRSRGYDQTIWVTPQGDRLKVWRKVTGTAEVL